MSHALMHLSSWCWVRVSVSGKCVFGVWFVIKQHVLKVMIIMSCIRVLYKSVLSICSVSLGSAWRQHLPGIASSVCWFLSSLFGAVWAWIQVFWIRLYFKLLEEVTQGRDELSWVSGVFTCRIGWWLIDTSVPDVFSLREFVYWQVCLTCCSSSFAV